MRNKTADNLIPEQQTGGESNTMAEVVLNNEQEANHFFSVACQRLMNVNEWHDLAGAASANFILCDAIGNEMKRTAQKGDFIKIDIPGPGTVSGEGYDWVQIEAIEKVQNPEEESLLMRVRPASNPLNEKGDTAHFFTEEATSNFVVRRQGLTIKAEVHGRNEKPNISAETVVDKARNAAVATGAITVFSKLQWKSLVNGLVQLDQ
jgi:hypothetical protein